MTMFALVAAAFFMCLTPSLPGTNGVANAGEPTVVSIERHYQNGVLNLFDGWAEFRVTFSEDVTGVRASSFNITGAPQGLFGISKVDDWIVGRSHEWVVRIPFLDVSYEGALGLELSENAIVQIRSSSDQQLLTSTTPTGTVESYVVDLVEPKFEYIRRYQPVERDTIASTVVFAVKFTEPMSEVPASAFGYRSDNSGRNPPTGPNLSLSISESPGDDTLYLVTVSGIDGYSGAFGIDVPGSKYLSIKDPAGNYLDTGPVGQVGWYANEHPDNQTYKVTYVQPFLETVKPIWIYRGDYETFETLVTFNKPVPDFQVSDMRLTNGATATRILSNTDDTRYGIEIKPVADGEIYYDIEKSRLGLGPTSQAALTQRTIVDTVDPAITISGVPSVTDGTTPFTASFAVSELTWGWDADYLEINEILVTNATASNFEATNLGSSSRPTVYTALITPNGNGDVSVSVPAGVINDPTGNRNAATPVASALLDTAAPTVSISGVPPSVGTQPFTATFTVSEQTSGFEWNDVVVVNAFASAFDASNAPVFTALISPDGNGDVSVSIPENAMIDAVGNGNTASEIKTATLDTIAPTVSISGVPPITNTTPFTTTFTVSEATSDFDINDVDVVNASVSAFDASNAPVFTAAITPDGNGDVSVSVAVEAMTDLAGNGNIASVVATAVLDTTVPSITISGVPAVTGTAPFTATFTFSKKVRDFAIDDLVLVNATASAFDESNAPVYTAQITPDGNGDVLISVDAGAAQDAAGNLSVASAISTAAFDVTAPTVSFRGVPASTGPAGFVATIVVSEETSGFDISDLVLVNATASLFDSGRAPLFTVQITPDESGDILLSVPADSMVDTAGFGNAASETVNVTLDTAPPAVSSIETEDSDPANGQLSWKVTFSESVRGVGPQNFNVEGVTGANITVTPLFQEKASLYPMTPAGFLRELIGVRSAHAANPPATQYLVTVSGGNVATLTGSAVLVFGSAAGITDASGQGLVSVTPTGINQSAINPDTDAPTVAQIVAPARVEGAFDANVIFSEPVTGFDATDLTVTNATVDAVTPQAPVGGFATVFTVRLTPQTHGQVTIAVVASAAADAAGNQSTASGTLTISYLDAHYVQTRTGAVIRNFLSQRASNILSSQPGLSGRLMDQSGLGATEKFAVSTNYEAGSLQVNFAGSLTRLMAGQAISEMADEKTYGYGATGTGNAGKQGRTTRFNLWVKGNLSKSKLDGSEQGFGSFHVGADYRVTPDLMVGTLVQFDWADESNATAATSASGTGWLAGPYAVYRLHQNVIVDGYVAYGQSDNKVSPFGTYIDSFDTNRFLARGQITGDFNYAGWTVAPQLAASYLVETQKAYVDSNGVSIPEQDIEVGQLSFGPTFRKNHVLDNDVVLTPSLAIKGIWNFKKAGTADITTGAITGSAQDKLRARLELGVGARFTDNFRLTSSGYVDGLGQNGYSGYGGTLGLNLRF
ncbi:Ig-like domain-containing protein [Hoeflea sp.]|uniref:Ig-like domain-containing protein n=1 Tax=Hoeflea sp. TaxID=1940281 RepID=UPI003BB03D85